MMQSHPCVVTASSLPFSSNALIAVILQDVFDQHLFISLSSTTRVFLAMISILLYYPSAAFLTVAANFSFLTFPFF